MSSPHPMMSCIPICHHAFVAPAPLSIVIRETYASLQIQKKIRELSDDLHEYHTKLRCQSTFHYIEGPLDVYETQDLIHRTEVEIKTMMNHAQQTRPPRLSSGEIGMITQASLSQLTKNEIAVLPEIVSQEEWDLLAMIIKKIE